MCGFLGLLSKELGNTKVKKFLNVENLLHHRGPDNTGTFKRGYMEAELDIKDDLWFFKCHFQNDPVMPGCLGLDAMWQLLGFYLGWLGLEGKGRALSVGGVKFSGMVLPTIKKLEYQINLKRVLTSKLILGIGDGLLVADGEVIYKAEDLRVGLFK